MALGRSPPQEIRSPDERGAAEDGAEAEAAAEEVFDDAFDIPHKNAPHDRLRRWRQAALVLNASRRFRYTLDLKKEEEKEIIRRKIRSHAQVIRAAFLFKEAGQKDTREAYSGINLATASRSFPIELEKLTTLNREHDSVLLQEVGGVKGLSNLLKSNLDKGVNPNEDEVLLRRNVYGANTYPRKKRKNILRFVFEACQDLTLVILMVAAAISLTLGMTTEGVDEGWYDGGSIFLAVFLVILVTAISDYRQSLQFRHLNEEKQNIQVEVPADGVLISGHSLAIDESSMTGESKIVHKDQKAPFLMSGCKVADGYGSMLVTGVGTNTEWGQLMANLSEDNGEETPLQVRLNGVATFIGLVGLSVAGAVLIVLWIRYFTGHTENPDGTTQFVAGTTGVKKGFMGAIRILTIAVTIVVVAVPEGLPLAVTLTLAYSMKKMMRDKALVRRLSSCETMGSATTICCDKTGTLTLNKMTVVEAYFAGTKLDPCDDISQIPDNSAALIIEGIAQNTIGTVFLPEDGSETEITGSPTEKAILFWGLKIGMDFHDMRSKSSVIHVFPFNSEKKRGAVAVQSDEGVHVHWKGAAEIVLSSCKSWLSVDGSVQPMSAEKHDEYKKSIEDMAANSLRCVAFAYCACDIEMIPKEDIANWKLPEDDLTLLGIVGIKVRMVTGDNIETAKAIALECGILGANDLISEPVVIEGKVFREMSESARADAADKIIVMGRSSPNDKLLLVQALKRKGHVVAVTGDGTNDAPALHEADIGLSMGISGTEVAKESSDIIILDDDFTSVVKVVRWGRSVYANIQKFIQFQLTVNVAALVINVVAAVSSGDVPLNAVELLWVNLIMDTLGALALATEPPTDNLMKRTPVGRRQALYQVAILLIFDFAGVKILRLQNESRYNAERMKNTFIFNTFVFCQLAPGISREDHSGARKTTPGLFQAPLLSETIAPR
ncbi:Calcium-transporting ATPase 8, plasma membrane-type [Dichanthelium oligosanthes]|uniref:Calcium-transporting ATPase n=1 Tax=Dichanthelium oligosanthes TaxID=888268 RepID=A0A1E5UPD4_9POAL|nr:Calcium-transporting ATPase 8, plasma membrane-type [Dichanthelium oligosanthes]